MSEIKKISQNTLLRIDKLVRPRINNALISYFWNKFFIPYGTTILNKIPEPELKAAYTEAYNELKPLFETAQVAHQLKEAKQLNNPKQVELLMKLPNFKKYEEIIDGIV